ncbi:MAG: hypothetical protein DRQ89_12855, partial [Epsilonproteobacteria bacterium]
MKLSSKEEAKILKVYKSYWEGYISGDVAGMSRLLDNKYTQVGSAEAEVFSNKKEAVKFLHATIDQVAGKAEIRNQSITLDYLEDYILVNDLFDIYVLTEGEWVYYAKLRASTLMSEDKGKWKFIHQHSSVPDIRTEDGENIATEKIAKENLQLRDAIKRRTVELESKNRELEIETSLERVRARAMAMNKSEELGEAAVLLYQELIKLGVNQFFSCGYVLVDEKNKKQYGWLTDGEGDFLDKLSLPLKGDSVLNPRYKSWQRKDPIFSQTVGGEEFKKHQAFVTAGMDSKEMEKVTFQLPDPTIFYSANFSHGYLHILSSVPLSKEEESILVRFTSVFQMTYRRFLDLKKAEEQAREAQIEAGLDKVRAEMMAMHQSDELRQVVHSVFTQLQNLGFEAPACSVIVYNHDLSAEHWFAGFGRDIYPRSYKIPYVENSYFTDLVDAWKNGTPYQEFSMIGKLKIKYAEWLLENSEFKELPKEFKKEILNPDELLLSDAFNKYGMLEVIGPESLDEVRVDILKRFSMVFEQTYTRFLDLQKAEEQAREAEIELALERVRARTMAMQKSEELKEVVAVQYEQMGLLDMADWASNIIIMDEPKKSYELWLSIAEQNILPESYTLDIKGHKLLKEQWKIWQNQLEGRHIHLEGQAKKEYDKYVLNDTDLIRLPVKVKKAIKSISEMYVSMASMKCGLIASFNFNAPLSKSEFQILQRFAKVFDQTYTRFLDLQKAEAQAREAQIEVALERVRARSLAMHKSDELSEVIGLVFQQFIKLGIRLHHANFVVGDAKDWAKTNRTFWVANLEISHPFKVLMPYIDHPMFNRVIQGAKKGSDFLEDTFEFEEKNSYFRHWFNKGIRENRNLAAEKKVFKSPGYARSVAFFNDIELAIGKFKPVPFSSEENIILRRFAKVFEQTYTRFLDLQKAEAQAREAQIEASLERVRARTMAMQHSDEMPEVANNLFLQIQELGLPAWSAGYCTWEENKKSANCSMSSEGVIQKSFSLPTIGVGYDFSAPLKKGEKFYVAELGGKELAEHYKFMRKLPVVGEILDGILSAGFVLPTFQIWHIVYFKHGYLMFITYEPVLDAHDLFKRFALVFEQTYTRFLDLQNAEEQTREAQINLAVERVRAKALAMHKSEEIMEVVASLKEEVMSLDIPGVIAATIFLKEGDDKVRMWDLTSLEELKEGYEIPMDITFKLKKIDPHLYVKRVWENPKNYFVETQDEKGFKRLVAWAHERDKHKDADELEEFIQTSQLKRLYHAAKKLNNGKLVIDLLNPPADEMESILTKMGAAFDLAYKRFEDLQKAEEQAREAQIEAALERVRSRSLAMHKSEELKEVIQVIFNQLTRLGINAEHAGIVVDYKAKEDWNFWIAEIQDIPSQVTVPYLDALWDRQFTEAKEKGKDFFATQLNFEEKNSFYEELLKHIPGLTKKARNFYLSCPGLAISTVIQDDIGLYVENFSGTPYSDEENSVLIRFGKVFQQTYTRFLDLQKAEEQAREAQIEAALERVRSKSMAMHKSEDIGETVSTLFDELLKVGIHKSSRSGIGILNETKEMKLWSALSNAADEVDLLIGNLDMTINPLLKRIKNVWKKQDEQFYYELEGKELSEYYASINQSDEYLLRTDLNKLPEKEFIHVFTFKHGIIYSFNSVPISEEAKQVFKRFAKVFEQTYTRFLDLQKAEEQTREAQIEAALERVRSRTLAMHKSSELSEAGGIIFKQLGELGIEAETSFISLIDIENDILEIWTAHGSVLADPVKVKASDHPNHKAEIETWKTGQGLIEIPMPKKDFINLVKAKFNIHIADQKDQSLFYLTQIRHQFGFIGMGTWQKLNSSEISILTRFTKVFEQTYTRFLDLQKAEEQAREAQIEAALERIRAQAMAMKESSDLLDIVVLMRREFVNLGHEAHYFWHMRWLPDTYEKAMTSGDGTRIGMVMKLPRHIHGNIKLIDQWEKSAEHTVVYAMNAETAVDYVNKMVTLGNFEQIDHNAPGSDDIRAIGGLTFIMARTTHGEIGFSLPGEVTNPPTEDLEALVRFAGVFDLAYKRFEDLLTAEQQNRETEIELALERVRARALAMQKPEELKEVAEVLRREMGALGVEELETCSIYINDVEADKAECWYALKDIRPRKKKLVADHFALDLKDTWVGRKMLKFYNTDEEQTSIVMKGKNRVEWIRYCEDKSVPFRGYYGEEIPDRTYQLYKFSHGAIGAATPGEISDENWGLLKRAATVFSLAYSRFKDLSQALLDLQKLKEEKHRAENALTELKST